MKDRWDQRVYIDLFAGAGFSKIEGKSIIVKGSPIIALTVSHPFDKYIFCEEDPANMQALRARCSRLAPSANIEFVEGDCHQQIDRICAAIPRARVSNTVLSLCFVDPFDFGFKFSDLQRLSQVFIDFLVLLAVGMDANRNYEHYVEGNSSKLDEALGNTEWRRRWKGNPDRSKFISFLAREFASSMEGLGYLKQEVHRMKLVRSSDKNLPLYYLALFSRSETAYNFWAEVLRYGTDQVAFNWE